MGRCIVCNKFAGPFYSLHKTCYQTYQDTRENIRQIFSESIESATEAGEFVNALKSCRPATSFSLSQFESLITRTWQEQAVSVAKSKSLDDRKANYLLEVVPALGIKDKDIEPYLLQRLANIQHLVRINQGQPVERVFAHLDDRINLEDEEIVVWVFEEVLKMERQHPIEDNKWGVWRPILNNLFNKSRYKEATVKIEATGMLIITSRNLYFVAEKGVAKICLEDIYAATPMKDGIRIQTRQRNAVPDTYVTGDGRFTYALLHYAQGQRQEN